MKLIVGLGNPGNEYENTRHNVGFMLMDRLLYQISKIKDQNNSLKFQTNNRCKALIAKTEEIVLVKPQTFMNASGKAVKSLAIYYKVKLDDIYVVHDDLDILLGDYKINLGKGPKVHNGLNSIIEALGSDQFWRIRIGIESRGEGNRVPGKAFVLQPFSKDEESQLTTVTEALIAKITGDFIHV
jgi:PTH1 family peptidyl-tRNA hydrolase